MTTGVRHAARQRQRHATSGSPGATTATRSRFSRAPDDRAYRDKLYAVVGVTGVAERSAEEGDVRSGGRLVGAEGVLDQPEPRRRSGPTICRRSSSASTSRAPRDGVDDRPTRTRGRRAGRRRGAAGARPRRRRRRRKRRSISSSGTTRIRACRRSRKCRKRATAPTTTPRSIASQPKKFVRLADDEMRNVTVQSEAEQVGATAPTTASTS